MKIDKLLFGVLMLLAALGYSLWLMNKKKERNNEIFSKIDRVNSWGIIFFLILVGLVFILKNE